MSRLKLGLLAALFLMLFLAALAPARLVLMFVPEGQAQLQGVSGNLWQGSASRVVVNTDIGKVHLGRVSWDLSPFSLLLLAPRVDIESSWGQQYLNATLTLRGASGLDLADVDARVAADLARQFLPVELAGLFSLQAPLIELRDGLPVTAEGRLVWQQGGWKAGGAIRPLGDYALEFEQLDAGLLAGEVITLSGELRAAGTVSLRGREYSVDVLLSGPGLDDRQLQQSLQLVATPEGDSYRVKLQGPL